MFLVNINVSWNQIIVIVVYLGEGGLSSMGMGGIVKFGEPKSTGKIFF